MTLQGLKSDVQKEHNVPHLNQDANVAVVDNSIISPVCLRSKSRGSLIKQKQIYWD